MSEHLKGLIITTLGVLFVVPDSLFVRLIDAEPLVVAPYDAIGSYGVAPRAHQASMVTGCSRYARRV